MSETNLIILVQ